MLGTRWAPGADPGRGYDGLRGRKARAASSTPEVHRQMVIIPTTAVIAAWASPCPPAADTAHGEAEPRGDRGHATPFEPLHLVPRQESTVRPGCKAPTPDQVSTHSRHAGPLSCPVLCLEQSPWPHPAPLPPMNSFIRWDHVLLLWSCVPFLCRHVISGTGLLAC